MDRPDASTALLGAIRAALNAESTFVLEEVRTRAWASVTFTGARHEIAFRLEGDTAEFDAGRFLGGLTAREFPMQGHTLCDIALVSEVRRAGWARIELEALTVEDRG